MSAKKGQKNRIRFFTPRVVFGTTFIYLLYRIALVLVPLWIIGSLIIMPGASVVDSAIVCSPRGEESNNLVPVLSTQYQQMVKDQKALSPNLVANPGITDIDFGIGQPVGYTRNIDGKGIAYQIVQDVKTGQNFLRVNDEGANKNDNRPRPAWMHDAVDITPGRTYAYGFDYRSDVPVNVVMEYSNVASPSRHYLGVVTLGPSTIWQAFSAHFDNVYGATSFRVVASGSKPGRVDLKSLDVHRIGDAGLLNGVVSVVFEDGWKSVDSAAVPLLAKYNIRPTQYVISNASKTDTAEYMSFDTLRRMKALGYEIGSHSYSHCDQTTLGRGSIMNDADSTKAELEIQGLGPIDSFAYPLGRYNATTQDIYSRRYKYALTSDAGYNDRYFDNSRILSMGVLDTTTDAEFRSWLEYARRNRLWLVVAYHQVDRSGMYSVSHAQLESQLKMVHDSGLIVLPVSEAARIVRN